MFVIPAQTKDQYIRELLSSKSSTNACVYIEDDEQIDENYVKMRQCYINNDEIINSLMIQMSEIDAFLEKLKSSSVRNINEIAAIESRRRQMQANLKAENDKAMRSIKDVYYIISHGEFLNVVSNNKSMSYAWSNNGQR
jgi:hypothetical protein